MILAAILAAGDAPSHELEKGNAKPHGIWRGSAMLTAHFALYNHNTFLRRPEPPVIPSRSPDEEP